MRLRRSLGLLLLLGLSVSGVQGQEPSEEETSGSAPTNTELRTLELASVARSAVLHSTMLANSDVLPTKVV